MERELLICSDKVSAGIDLIFGGIDQTDDAVAVGAGLVLFSEVQLGPIVDGGTMLVGNHLDQRSFSVSFVDGWFEDHGQLLGIQHNQASDRDDADTVNEEFEECGVKALSGFRKHNAQYFGWRDRLSSIDA